MGLSDIMADIFRLVKAPGRGPQGRLRALVEKPCTKISMDLFHIAQL